MAKIKKDRLGIYVTSGGYIARPTKSTRYNEGDNVKTHHYGGSPLHGVGKDDTCGRGEYVETWIGTGSYDIKSDEQRQEKYDWYMNYAKKTYPLMFEE